jgi:hypothetical protein
LQSASSCARNRIPRNFGSHSQKNSSHDPAPANYSRFVQNQDTVERECLRRYQIACNRTLLRIVVRLRKRHREADKAKEGRKRVRKSSAVESTSVADLLRAAFGPAVAQAHVARLDGEREPPTGAEVRQETCFRVNGRGRETTAVKILPMFEEVRFPLFSRGFLDLGRNRGRRRNLVSDGLRPRNPYFSAISRPSQDVHSSGRETRADRRTAGGEVARPAPNRRRAAATFRVPGHPRRTNGGRRRRPFGCPETRAERNYGPPAARNSDSALADWPSRA